MTTMSPSELDTVTRFGMFDTEILNDLAEHADDVIPCEPGRGCGAQATVRLIRRCCRVNWNLCAEHRAIVRVYVATAPGTLFCPRCDHVFAVGSTFEDIYREVTL